jgi:hypothetical protein
MTDEYKYIEIANEFGFNFNRDEGTFETFDEKHILILSEKELFLRDSSCNYHGYTFKYVSPGHLRAMLELIQDDL